jgi:hypothetical protein
MMVVPLKIYLCQYNFVMDRFFGSWYGCYTSDDAGHYLVPILRFDKGKQGVTLARIFHADSGANGNRQRLFLNV